MWRDRARQPEGARSTLEPTFLAALASNPRSPLCGAGGVSGPHPAGLLSPLGGVCPAGIAQRALAVLSADLASGAWDAPRPSAHRSLPS